MRALGIVAFLCYAIHCSVHLYRGAPYNLLWGCHIAALLVGLGLLLRNPTLNAIGFLWSCLGLPLWIIDIATGGEFIVTSPLTHVGGFVLGFIGVRKMGMPRGAAIKAMAAMAALMVICRVVTPPAANVNLAFHVKNGWEAYFPSYALYFAMLFAITGAIFVSVERVAA